MPGTASSQPSWFATLGKRVYFAATSQVTGNELWTTDGTPAGTRPVLDLYPGPMGSFPTELLAVGDKLYFAATDPVRGRELWVSDGTKSSATHVVEDLYPGPQDSAPAKLTRFRDGVVFRALDAPDQHRPYFTKGSAGTTHAIDGGSAPLTLYPTDFAVLGSQLLYSAYSRAAGTELWRSAGGSGDATLVKDIYPGGYNSGPSELAVLGDQVVFAAYQPAVGYELWTTDGTDGGTQVVRDINPGPANDSSPGTLLTHLGAAYFIADDGAHGSELWSTDGTPGGTRMVKDINPGTGSSKLYGPRSVGRSLLFTADDGIHGYESWTTDGTSKGTRLLADLLPGTGVGSYPSPVATLGSTLLFGAKVGTSDRVLAYTSQTSTTHAYPKRSYTRTNALKRRIRVTVKVAVSGTAVRGTVVLRRGTKTIGRARLTTQGIASVRITTRLRKGTHTMKASYSGSIHAQASTTTVKVRIR